MSKCGCSGSTCSCKIVGGNGVVVTGAGSAANPYVIQTGTAFSVSDSSTVDLTLLGNGSASAPWLLSAELTAGLDDLVDVNTAGGTTGQVLARQADGTYALVPPATAAPGAVATGNSLEGDGSSGDPLNARLAPLSGLTISTSGLAVSPYVVDSEANLDSTYGALPVGEIVALDNGTAAWMRTSTGWIPVFEDTGLISGTTSDKVVPNTSWTISSLTTSRRNGIVQIHMTASYALAINADGVYAGGPGNFSSVGVATIVDTRMRPRMPTGVVIGGSEGMLAAGQMLPNGQIGLGSNFGVDIPAGVLMSFQATFIGA